MSVEAYESFPSELAWVVWSKIPIADIRAEELHV